VRQPATYAGYRFSWCSVAQAWQKIYLYF
jgi:hypothetical protein